MSLQREALDLVQGTHGDLSRDGLAPRSVTITIGQWCYRMNRANRSDLGWCAWVAAWPVGEPEWEAQQGCSPVFAFKYARLETIVLAMYEAREDFNYKAAERIKAAAALEWAFSRCVYP